TATYDAQSVRREPRATLLDRTRFAPRKAKFQPGDVVLVTGGAKGITAECALALAERTGIRLALTGTSAASSSPEIERTLARATAAKITARYYRADISNRTAVNDLLTAVKQDL